MNLGSILMYRYNNTLITILLILIQLKVIQQILFNLYLWQLKEYRWDRLKEHLQRTYRNPLIIFLSLTILSPLKLPQKSLKALGIFILNLMVNLTLFMVNSPYWLAFSLFITPFILTFSLLIIFPFEYLLRRIIYTLALRKIVYMQKNCGLTVIGITGSFGKTTTKVFLGQILSTQYKILETTKSVNTSLGISLLVLRGLNQSHQFFIVEMGAYKIGEIKELCQIVHPQIGVITGISNQHLALFGSQKNIIKAKSELLNSLTSGGLAIINKQSPWLPITPRKKLIKIVYYGTDKNLSLASKVISIPDFLKINLEPALILAKLYNINEKKIMGALTKLYLPTKTMQEIKGYNGATIIDDSYNANVEGTLAALEYIKQTNLLPSKTGFGKQEKKIVIMPCLIELGKQAKTIHQALGKRFLETVDMAIITTNDYFQEIAQGGRNNKKIICLTQPQQVIELLRRTVNKDTIILLEGRIHSSIIQFLTKT